MNITKQAIKMSEKNSLDKEQNQAYINIVGGEYADADSAEEAYAGQFASDRCFAMDMAEQLGEFKADMRWPHSCIDWGLAGNEIMYDYSEDSGYYFRNL